MPCHALQMPRPRHHLVPRMYLQRFAKDNKLRVTDRRTGQSRLTTVKNACNEAGYYAIPTEDLKEQAREGHDPEMLEKTLAEIESESATYIAELLTGGFPPSPPARFRVSMFAALQHARGRNFRRDWSELANRVAPMAISEALDDSLIRQWLKSEKKPATDANVAALRSRLLGPNGPRPVLRQSHAVQASVDIAINVLHPRLFLRPWTLLQFDEPVLLTSDEPVVAWDPVDENPELATATSVYMPLDRQHALAFGSRGGDRISAPTGNTRATQINQAIIDNSNQWIFQHPNENPLLGLSINPPRTLTDELVSSETDGEMTREVRRLVRRRSSDS